MAAAERFKVLFLCTGNACRSQMAEGWARMLHPGLIEASSAGISPHGVNPLAIRAMAEAGVDISSHTSKHVDILANTHFDLVVTVCDAASEACPVFPNASRVLHAGFDDPPRLAKHAASDDEAMPHFRRIRDEIRRFIQTLPDMLTGEPHTRACCNDSCCTPETPAA